MFGATILIRRLTWSMCLSPDCAVRWTETLTTNSFKPTEGLGMSSKLLSLVRKSHGFRLGVWYFVIFIVSSLAVSIVSYVFLSSSLRDNRKAIQAKLQELLSLGQKAGVGAI